MERTFLLFVYTSTRTMWSKGYRSRKEIYHQSKRRKSARSHRNRASIPIDYKYTDSPIRRRNANEKRRQDCAINTRRNLSGATTLNQNFINITHKNSTWNDYSRAPIVEPPPSRLRFSNVVQVTYIS